MTKSKKLGRRNATKRADKVTTAKDSSKQNIIVELMRRPHGASIEELVRATGWQAHSVRGAISGTLKKRLGLAVTTDKVETRGRIYRLTGK